MHLYVFSARASERARIVCGNSDYAVRFDFDEEWEAYDLKTARFITEGGFFTDVQFEGSDCAVPVLTGTRTLLVGVFAGNLRTTTAALIHALPCVTDPEGTPADPAPDVYNQLMDRLNDLETIDPAEIDKAVKDYLTEHPIEETDPTVPAWAKQPQKPTYTAAEVCAATEADVTAAVNGAWTQAVAKLEPMFDSRQDKLNITNATAGQILQITAVDESGVPTAWEAVDLPSGAGSTWVKVHEKTLAEPLESYIYQLGSVRAAAIVIAPGSVIEAGWKWIKLNTMDIPVANGTTGANEGLAVCIDLDAPIKMIATNNSPVKSITSYGTSSSARLAITAGDIDTINQIGIITSSLLIAGAKISIYTK